MKYITYLLAILLTISAVLARAQASEPNLNRKDAQGKPDGLWYIYESARMGEPGKSEFGSYDHGNKTGLWYAADNRGNIVSIESYKYNQRDGEAQYFEHGQLVCAGQYKGLNPNYEIDTVLVVHPTTGDERLVYIPTERGSVRHGRWRYYDELTGRLIREENYQVDELIFRKDFPVSPADSLYYSERNKRLPHIKPAAPVYKQKEPVKSLIR